MQDRPATLAELFERQAQKYGARTFVRDKRAGKWVDHSWSEVSDAAGRLRAGLGQLGVKAGDRVAILSDNCPQWVIVDQAALGHGAVVVPLYTTSAVDETRHVLSDSGACIVAANGEQHVKRLLGLARDLPEMRAIVAMHPDASPQAASNGAPPVMTLESASAPAPAGIVEGSREELATIIYTSGTTGPSKGVMLTHGNILANCEDATAVLAIEPSDSILSFLPVAHSFERTAGYYAVMMGGGTISYAEGLGQIPQNLLETRPTLVLTVPRLLEVIYTRVLRTIEKASPLRRRLFETAVAVGWRAAEYRNRGAAVPPHLAAPMALFRRVVFKRINDLFGGRMRYLISGSAPLPVEINRFFSAAEVPIVEGYGLTEAAPIVSVNLLGGRNKIGTVGRALSHVEAKTAPDGELLVRGLNVMKGYYKRSQETREAIDDDGWLHTGDIARIDADGYITITDRKKEIIVLSGGKNVSPANIEMKLVRDAYVAQAMVIGDRRKHLAALLVPDFENLGEFLKQNGLAGKPPEELCESPALRKFFHERLREVNRQLSDVEALVAFTLLARPFTQEASELTPSLKLRRKVVMEHYKGAIESMFKE